MWDIFCVFGIFYTLILVILFIGKGIFQIIWPILLAFCAYHLFEYNSATEMFVVNEAKFGVPEWIFHPSCFIVAPILAVIIFVIITFAKK